MKPPSSPNVTSAGHSFIERIEKAKNKKVRSAPRDNKKLADATLSRNFIRVTLLASDEAREAKAYVVLASTFFTVAMISQVSRSRRQILRTSRVTSAATHNFRSRTWISQLRSPITGEKISHDLAFSSESRAQVDGRFGNRVRTSKGSSSLRQSSVVPRTSYFPFLSCFCLRFSFGVKSGFLSGSFFPLSLLPRSPIFLLLVSGLCA